MARTYMGLFDTADSAELAIHGIKHAGVPEEQIYTLSEFSDDPAAMTALAERLIGAGLSAQEATVLLARVRPGQTLVLVSTDDFSAETAYDTLRYQGMLDINQEATRERIEEREVGAEGTDPRFTPSETVGPSVSQKWDESNKLLTATGGVVGAVHGAAAGGLIGGPVGLAAGAVLGAAAGATGGGLADATFESVKQEDAARQEEAAETMEERRAEDEQ